MKKVISILLVLVMALGVFALTGCKKQTLRLGLGVYTSVSATDATEDKAGEGKATVTAAAVLLDKDGKIVKAVIDCADSSVKYDVDGKAQKAGEFKTKREMGKDYGMVAYAGSAKEWYEQADAFCELVIGKGADEVKALGHIYGDWVITKQPTETDDGIREKSCTACGDQVTESIPAVGEVTTEEITTEEITTEEITTEEITTEEITTEEITTEEITTDEITTEEITTEQITTEEVPTVKDTDAADATEELPDESKSKEEETTGENKDGCRGAISAGVILFALAMGVCVFFKKKED